MAIHVRAGTLSIICAFFFVVPLCYFVGIFMRRRIGLKLSHPFIVMRSDEASKVGMHVCI